MVHAMIDIKPETNRILNIVKATHGLSNKSEAIDALAIEYADELLEPELRPEYVKKLERIEKEPFVIVKDFKKHFGLKK